MTDDLKIRDFLNLESDTELHLFLQKTPKKTSQMRYDEFVKHSLEKFRPILTDFLVEQDAIMKACATQEELEKLEFPKMPAVIRDQIIDHIDKQKLLNIVERCYLCLDLMRAVGSEIEKRLSTALLHYGNAFKAAANLTGSGGGRILGLNGRPLS